MGRIKAIHLAVVATAVLWIGAVVILPQTKPWHTCPQSASRTGKEKSSLLVPTAIPRTSLYNFFKNTSASVENGTKFNDYDASVAFGFLTEPRQWRQLLAVAHRLRKVGLQHDMIALMLQPNGSKPQLNMPAVEAAFAELRLELQFINPVYRPPTVQLRPKSPNFVVAWSKFAFFHVTKYSKIVVLDTDIIVMRDPSNLARIPAFAAVQTGCNEGPPDFAHLNAGCFIMEPNNNTFNELMVLASTPSPTHWEYNEQELLNVYYTYLRPSQFFALSQFHAMPAGHAEHLVKQLFPKGKHWLFKTMNGMDALKAVQIVHFVCSKKKPWQIKRAVLQAKRSISGQLMAMWYDHMNDACKRFPMISDCCCSVIEA